MKINIQDLKLFDVHVLSKEMCHFKRSNMADLIWRREAMKQQVNVIFS